MVRRRPGTFTYSEIGTAPDQRRNTSLALVLRRVRGTSRRLAQAGRAQTVLGGAGSRERQPVGLGRAPAFAGQRAFEYGAAARAGERAGGGCGWLRHGGASIRD